MMEQHDDANADKAVDGLLDTECLVIGRWSDPKRRALELAEQQRYRCLSWFRKILYHFTGPAD